MARNHKTEPCVNVTPNYQGLARAFLIVNTAKRLGTAISPQEWQRTLLYNKDESRNSVVSGSEIYSARSAMNILQMGTLLSYI